MKSISPSDEIYPIGKHIPVAAAQNTSAPAILGGNSMAPSVATEDKATFTEESVGSKN